jgi:putative FmdB family regulatory protein
MPTYEYRCPEGHEFERFYRKISDSASELPCPTCGKLAERKLSGGAGLVFKGSGFYLTDYGKNAHRKGGDGGGKPSSGSSESGSGDASGAKPAESKADAKAGETGASAKAESKSSESKSTSGPSTSGGKSES